MVSWDTLHGFSDEMNKISGIAPILGGAVIGGLLGAAGGATTAGEGRRLRGAVLGGLGGAGVGALGVHAGRSAIAGHKGLLSRLGEAEFKARSALPMVSTPLAGPQAKALRKLHGIGEKARSSIRGKVVGLGAGGGIAAYGGGRVLGRTGQSGEKLRPHQPRGG